MTTIPQFISFLISALADLLTSDLLYPFVVVWVAAYVIYLTLNLMKGGKRR